MKKEQKKALKKLKPDDTKEVSSPEFDSIVKALLQVPPEPKKKKSLKPIR